MDKNEALAMEMTKLVVSQAGAPSRGDVFRVATDCLSIYRYILKDLKDHH